MTQSVITTETLAESGTAEEAKNKEIVDQAFVPSPPVYGQIPEWAAYVAAYSAATKYEIGEFVYEGGIVYEAIKAETEGEAPASHPSAWKATSLSTGHYAVNALVQEKGTVYRALAAITATHKPSEDADNEHWVIAPTDTLILVNGDYNYPTSTYGELNEDKEKTGETVRNQGAGLVEEHKYAEKPPARSDAAAHASETVAPGNLVPATGE